MRITVECGGFTRAADACVTANQTSAVLTESLASRLAAGAGMAGDDATSSTFARAYDDGAQEAVAALTDLTHAFIGAGRLLGMTADNHARAEAAAAGLAVHGYSGGSIDDDAYVRIHRPRRRRASVLEETSLGTVDAWILDQVEGFVWPSGDVDQLRASASAWRRAAASVAGLADHVDAAVALVEQQRSPEVPLAVDALTGLATLIGDTAWQVAHLATACEDYADAVEAARDRTRALLSEIAQMIVEGAAISVLVAGLSGGFGGGAAAAAAAARVRAQAPRFFALLARPSGAAPPSLSRGSNAPETSWPPSGPGWRSSSTSCAGRGRGDEAPARVVPRKEPGWLRRHEVPPGHTIKEHVGRTADELVQRCRTTGIKRASSFSDEADAERLIDSVLEEKTALIRQWRRSGSDDKLGWTWTFPDPQESPWTQVAARRRPWGCG